MRVRGGRARAYSQRVVLSVCITYLYAFLRQRLSKNPDFANECFQLPTFRERARAPGPSL